MAVYTYNDVRKVLRKLGFQIIRIKKHETWEKVLGNGTIFQTRLSHKGKRTIPKGTFSEILKQIGLQEEKFRQILKK